VHTDWPETLAMLLTGSGATNRPIATSAIPGGEVGDAIGDALIGVVRDSPKRFM
jgi:hypothetical protein